MKKLLIICLSICLIFALSACSFLNDDMEYIKFSGVGQAATNKVELKGTWLAGNMDEFTFKKNGTFSRKDSHNKSTSGNYMVLDGVKLVLDYSNSADSTTYMYELDGKKLTLEDFSTKNRVTYYGDPEKQAELRDKHTIDTLIDTLNSWKDKLAATNTMDERRQVIEQYEGSIASWKAEVEKISDSEKYSKSIKKINDLIWDLNWEVEHKP